MTKAEIFEGTGVKRYALRCKKNQQNPWDYPADMQFDTVEEAKASLAALPNGYQVVEKCLRLRYGPVGYGSRTKLLDNALAACGLKLYKLQRWTRGGGWESCNDLQFDTLRDAQAAVESYTMGEYRVLKASLDIRYKPVDG